MSETIQQIAHFIEAESGISFKDDNLYQLKTRIESFIKDEQISSVDTLISKINSFGETSLKQKLIDKATNNETLFFRDSNFFKGLEELIKSNFLNNHQLNIWSAASSTGQEALSVSILLEEMKTKMKVPEYRIKGTDICQKVLKKAQEATYTEFEINRGLSPELKKKYFTEDKNGYKANSQIISKINYSYNNLLKPQVFDKFDIILCRNILIYQNADNKKKIVETLMGNLNPKGYIVLGGGETLLWVKDQIQKENYSNYMFYRL